MVVIVVVMSVMVFTYSTGLLGALLVPPRTATEAVNIDYTYLQNNKAMSMFVRNTGSTPITMSSYYVKDSSGDEYTRASWVSPTISPTAVQNMTILINTACSTCSLTGSSFTYQTGQAYTVTLVTLRNGLFTFTIVP